MKNSENQRLRDTLSHLKTQSPESILAFAWQELHWKAPSSDHVLFGLAVMANQKGMVKTLLSKNPQLMQESCVVPGMIRLTAMFPAPGIYEDIPSLHAAIATKSWQVAEVLVERGGLKALPFLDVDAFAATIDGALGANHVNVVRPALRFAKILLDAGAPMLGSDEDGMTPFGTTLNSLIFYPPWGEANGSFRATVEVMEFFLPYLSAMNPSVFAKGTQIHDSLVDDLETLQQNNQDEQPVDRAGPGMVWFREKTGINLPSYQECLIAWLLSHGLDIEPVNDFARTHVPAALAFNDRRHLESVLPEVDTPVEPPAPTRFRL
jgi:hypothetical protein